jgi:thioredoxin-like negative regulator of GroEL
MNKSNSAFINSERLTMGMRVGSSMASMAPQVSAVGGWQQRQQGMKDLVSQINAGDLAGAQKAYASFAANNNIKSDSAMGQIGEMLKTGDMSGAEKILQSMQVNKSTSPVSAQANANNQQVASTLSMFRGQGGQIDTLV